MCIARVGVWGGKAVVEEQKRRRKGERREGRGERREAKVGGAARSRAINGRRQRHAYIEPHVPFIEPGINIGELSRVEKEGFRGELVRGSSCALALIQWGRAC